MSYNIESQRTFWNAQHQVRGTTGVEGNDYAYIPNTSAQHFAEYLPPASSILELGCANGRDTRWFATQGHKVLAVDFSNIALQQMMQLALMQKVTERIRPVMYDYSNGTLPAVPLNSLDAFYARSALHMPDDRIQTLMAQITMFLKPGGLVLIEGKDEGDKKIQASKQIKQGLVVNMDDGGHIRRVWNKQCLSYLCSVFSWKQIHLTTETDRVNKDASFIRLIARTRLL